MAVCPPDPPGRRRKRGARVRLQTGVHHFLYAWMETAQGMHGTCRRSRQCPTVEAAAQGSRQNFDATRPDPDRGPQTDVKIGRAHVELQSLMRISYAVFCLKKKN